MLRQPHAKHTALGAPSALIPSVPLVFLAALAKQPPIYPRIQWAELPNLRFDAGELYLTNYLRDSSNYINWIRSP